MDPSPPHVDSAVYAAEKARLRKHYRSLRREHVAALPVSMRALMFMRPPVPVLRLIPDDAVVGLYHAHADEAPTLSYARWLHENGRIMALPYFPDRIAPMHFRVWSDPYVEQLQPGPFGVLQPMDDSPVVAPSVVFVPLLAFTSAGERLGQGGGHYDRWLEAHPATAAVGLAWDTQLAETLPIESHDRRLDAVVTPTRFYESEQ